MTNKKTILSLKLILNLIFLIRKKTLKKMELVFQFVFLKILKDKLNGLIDTFWISYRSVNTISNSNVIIFY